MISWENFWCARSSSISEFLKKFEFYTYVKIVNSILLNVKSFKTYIYCLYYSFGFRLQFNTQKSFQKQDLKWGYSFPYGYYIGFKATIVIKHKSELPVAIIIHSSAPHDTKIFIEIMDNLQKRRIIRNGDIFVRIYYSYINYQIGISKYKIVPLIFPKENFKIKKLIVKLTYLLHVFKDENTRKLLKNYIIH